MPIKPTEMERIILVDGLIFIKETVCHRHYIHPSKPGKVTIPFHKGKELNKITENSIRKQAGIK